MRAAYLWGLVVMVTGCASQPVPQPVSEATALQNAERRASTADTSEPKPVREHHVVWMESGHKAEEGWIVGGKRDGKWTTWQTDGVKKWEGEYREGIQIGVWKYWGQYGRPESQRFFADGELTMVRRYRSNGLLSAEEHYADGTREGRWTKVQSDGTETSTFYNRGTKLGSQSDTVSAVGYRLKYAPDAKDRVQAALDLAQHSAESWNAIPDLMAGLDDPDSRVVRECAVVLGIMGSEARDAVGRLTELTGHQDKPIAEAAKVALRQIEAEDRSAR